MKTVLPILVAWATAGLLLPPLIALSWCVGALDVPTDWRRMHRNSVPRVGGVAVLFAFVVGVFLAGLQRELRFALLGGAFVFAVGLWDDLFGLPAWLKFFFHSVAAALTVAGQGIARGWWAFAAVFWVVLLTNAHNFVDGLDGLFAGAAILEALGLAALLALGGRSALPPLLLAAPLVAFRQKNRSPASIFAGDCGSGMAGFLLAAFSIPAFSTEWSLGALAPVLVMAYPIADLLAAVLRRILLGRSIFEADRGHLHHRLATMGMPPVLCGRVLLSACGATVAVGVLLARREWAAFAALGCLLAVGVLLFLRGSVLRFAARENIEKTVDFPPQI